MTTNHKIVLACLLSVIIASATTATAGRLLITSAQIKDHTIQERDINHVALAALHGARGRAGLPGTTGAPGPVGAVGPAGTFSASVTSVEAIPGTVVDAGTIGQGKLGTSDARCSTGQVAISGGYSMGSSASTDVTPIRSTRDFDGDGWTVVILNHGPATTFGAYAYCIPVS